MNYYFLLAGYLLVASIGKAQVKVIIDDKIHHLRQDYIREWSEFPVKAESSDLRIEFNATSNSSEYTLQLTQYDVKQNWRVTLNDMDLGGLIQDEKLMLTYLKIPENLLRDKKNNLIIKTTDSAADDIKVGNIIIHQTNLQEVLGETSVDVEIVSSETKNLLPGRSQLLIQKEFFNR